MRSLTSFHDRDHESLQLASNRILPFSLSGPAVGKVGVSRQIKALAEVRVLSPEPELRMLDDRKAGVIQDHAVHS